MRLLSRYAILYLMATPSAEADIFVEAAATVMEFDYTEFDQNNVFIDDEQGLLNGRSVSIGYTSKVVDHVITHTKYDGQVDYTGETGGVSPQPLNTQTQSTWTETSYRQIWKSFQKHQGTTIYLDLSATTWNRNILPTTTPVASAGLQESYDWFSAEVGIFIDIIRTAQHALELGYGKFRSIDSTISVLLKGNTSLGTNDDTAIFSIGDKSGDRYTLAYRYRIDYDYIISVVYDKIETGFGGSSIIVNRPPTGINSTVTEPASSARHGTLSIRLAAYF